MATYTLYLTMNSTRHFLQKATKPGDLKASHNTIRRWIGQMGIDLPADKTNLGLEIWSSSCISTAKYLSSRHWTDTPAYEICDHYANVVVVQVPQSIIKTH